MQQCVETTLDEQATADSEAVSTKEACGIPSLSQDARTHYCAHAYAHTYAHAQSQACAFHEHANDSCQQNARSIENICGAASTPIRIQEACGIPLQSGCMHALLYARTCTHICTCARPSLLRLRGVICGPHIPACLNRQRQRAQFDSPAFKKCIGTLTSYP